MNINYDGGENINAPNIFPSNEPFATKTFTLTGKSTTNDNMNYNIILVIEENTFTDNGLMYKLESLNNDNNGNVAPPINELTGIPTESNEIFLGNGSFESPTSGNKLHTYSLELYFPDTIENQNDNQGKTFKSYISVREGKYEYNQVKGVNHPILFTGMTPIKWDENNNEINTTENDPSWYDYDNKKWANAKSQDGSYWVWIPRYAYKIETCYHTSNADCLVLTDKEAGEIDIKFLKGRGIIAEDNITIETIGYEPGVKDTSMHHFLHPAFDFYDGYLGFWVAKFEPTAHEELASGTTEESCDSLDNVSTKSPKIVPNAVSWRCINNSNAFKASLAMKDNPIYGWNANEVDTHMLTNEEWGAVAYLSKSQYGAPDEIWNNSFNGFKTGCSGPSVSANSQTTCTEYHTENGQKASTTHNIYGVYDMRGGTWENVMSGYNNFVSDTGFTEHEVINLTPKYYGRYYTSSDEWLNGSGMDYNPSVYGDAVYETSYNAGVYTGDSWTRNSRSSWFGNYAFIPFAIHSWFIRGGFHDHGEFAGLFQFSSGHGGVDYRSTFRPVLVPN